MLLEEFTNYLEKNIHRVFALNIQELPDQIFSLIANELSFSDEQISRLTESEFLRWYQHLFQFEFIKELLEQESFIELIIHNKEDAHLFDLHGHKSTVKINTSNRILNLAIEILAIKYKKQFSYEKPFTSFELPIFKGHYRISIGHYSTKEGGNHSVYLRKLSQSEHQLKDFVQEEKAHLFLEGCIKQKYNILVAGSTASGKTSLIKSMLKEIDPKEHIVIIEDTKELAIRKQNTTHLLSRDGRENDIIEYCSQLLRMRPDRVVLGEIRSAEVIPLLLNLNSGHRGLLTSIHANSAYDTLHRVATLFSIYGQNQSIQYEQILSLVCSNIDFVVHMELGKVKEVINVVGASAGQVTFDQII